MIKSFLTIIFVLLLSACASQSQYIMPPLTYNESMSVHIPKKAYLFWQHGLTQAGNVPAFHGQGIGGLVGSIIEAEDRKNNPSKYSLTYGKAEQASFITNLRDVLNKHHVFKEVEILANPQKIKPTEVLISVKFKSTRVGGFEHNHKIMLTVEMNIQSGNRVFTRTYLTESDEGELFKSKNYYEQITDASQQMLNQLMKGIKQWSQQR